MHGKKGLVKDVKCEAVLSRVAQSNRQMMPNEQRKSRAAIAGTVQPNLKGSSAQRRWLALVTYALLTLAGCGENPSKSYRVEKQASDENPTVLAQLPAEHPEIALASPRLTWTLPAGWTETKAGEFRLASFNIRGDNGTQADLGIFPLPGLAGGDVANVNRWRSQLGLEEVNQEQLRSLAQTIEVAGQPADLYDFSGEAVGSGDPTRILGAIQHRDGTAWFYKLTGDEELVAEQKPAFIAFLKSLKLAVAETASLPPSHPPIGGSDNKLTGESGLAGSQCEAYTRFLQTSR